MSIINYLLGPDPLCPLCRDIDVLAFKSETVDSLKSVFQEISQISFADDGLTYLSDTVNVNEIREEQQYGGLRVTLTAMLGSAKIHLQVDCGFGGAITPGLVVTDFPTLLDLPTPQLRTYPKETVVAEKFEAIVRLSMANSRMKDFYDLWVLAYDFPFSGQVITSAIQNTFAIHNIQTKVITWLEGIEAWTKVMLLGPVRTTNLKVEGQMGEDLQKRFDRAMLDIYRLAKLKAGYNATRYLRMLDEHGGLETAKILINAPTVSEGYTALYMRGRLDLTVEAVIFDNPEFQTLFTKDELEIIRKRLADYHYNTALESD